MSGLPATDDGKGDWDFEDLPVGPFNGRDQRHVILQNIRGLVRHGGSQLPIGAYMSYGLQIEAFVTALH